VAAALPATLSEVLITLVLPTRGAAAFLTTLLATLAALTTLTALTTLLLAVVLTGVTRVCASHNFLQCKRSTSTLANYFANVAEGRAASHPSGG